MDESDVEAEALATEEATWDHMRDSGELARQDAEQFEWAGRTGQYRKTTAQAVEIARERIEEWDYEEDPHGYCHERSVLIALVEAVTE